MIVRIYMTNDPVVLNLSTCLKDAQDLMSAYGVQHLPVVDPGDVFIGVVQQHDIRTELRMHGDEALKRAVQHIVVLGTPTLTGDDSTDDAWALLSRWPGYNPVPVVEVGKLVGTISQHELLRALAGLPPMKLTARDSDPLLPSEWAARSTPLTPPQRAQPISSRGDDEQPAPRSITS